MTHFSLSPPHCTVSTHSSSSTTIHTHIPDCTKSPCRWADTGTRSLPARTSPESTAIPPAKCCSGYSGSSGIAEGPRSTPPSSDRSRTAPRSSSFCSFSTADSPSPNLRFHCFHCFHCFHRTHATTPAHSANSMEDSDPPANSMECPWNSMEHP